MTDYFVRTPVMVALAVGLFFGVDKGFVWWTTRKGACTIEAGNPGWALRRTGMLLAFGTAVSTLLTHPGAELWKDALFFVLYAALMAALLLGAFIVNDIVLLKLDNAKAVSEGNLAAALVEAGSLVGAGIILRAVFTGQGGLVPALVFFLLGQLVFIVFFKIIELLTPYDDQSALERGDIPTGIDFCALLIALGLVLGSAASGDFTNWAGDLKAFGLASAKGVILLAAGTFLADRLVVGAGRTRNDPPKLFTTLASLGARVGLALVIAPLL